MTSEHQQESFLQNIRSYVLASRMDFVDVRAEKGGVEFWTFQFALFYSNFGKAARYKEDDLIYYVPVNPGDQVGVFRYESDSTPPLGSEAYNWRETVILNLLLHEFRYYLLVLVSSADLQHHKRTVLLELFPSTVAQNMKKKSELHNSYPYITFNINSYEEDFNNFVITNDSCMCVEVIAENKQELVVRASVFSGKLGFPRISAVYEAHRGPRLLPKSLVRFIGFADKKKNDKTVYFKFKGPGEVGTAELAMDVPDNISDSVRHSRDLVSGSKILRTKLTQITIEWNKLIERIFIDAVKPIFENSFLNKLSERSHGKGH